MSKGRTVFPTTITGKTFAVVAISVVIYITAVLLVGFDSLVAELAVFPRWTLVPLAALSCFNYGLRFWRWDIFLRKLGAQVPRRESAGLYFSTYLMVITPGKIGEVLKASILQDRYALPLTRGVPAVLVERIYDFLAVLALAVGGIFFWSGPLAGLGTGLMAAACLPLLLVLFQYRPFRVRLVAKMLRAPMLSRYRIDVDETVEAFNSLLTWRIFFTAFPVSVVAWLGECVGLWLVCRALQQGIGVGEAFFVYAAGTIVGSLSFLPGGIGGTEATIVWMLHTLDVSVATATTVALIVRLFTLWLAVLVGLLFFLGHRKLMLTAVEPDRPPAE